MSHASPPPSSGPSSSGIGSSAAGPSKTGLSKTGLANLSPIEQLRAPRLPRRLIQLFVGLSIYGISMALVIRSVLGQLPWDVFHVGVASHLPLTIGEVIIGVSFVVLLLWIPLRQMPGLGTIANAIWIGLATDVMLSVLSVPTHLWLRVLMMVAGIFLNGVATAMYIGSQLGPGPRDGLMTGLSRRTGWSLRLVRTAMEITVVVLGWLLGGTFGLGTILYALTIGPLTQTLLPWFTVSLEPGDSAR